MEIAHNWQIFGEDQFKIKVFTNIENVDEYVIRDQDDTGALFSMIISTNTIEIQEMSWAVSLKIDWENKTIYLKDSEEKSNS